MGWYLQRWSIRKGRSIHFTTPTWPFILCTVELNIWKLKNCVQLIEGLSTKPLINTIDGTPTFLSPDLINGKSGEGVLSGQIRKRSRTELERQGLNETELIFELVKDICNDLDIRSLCHKILQNVGILTSADR